MRECTVTSLPMSLPESPFGIVIHSGEPPKRPALIWAYMWAEDKRDESEPWHRRTPVSHNG
jgi:hypothetical protein